MKEEYSYIYLLSDDELIKKHNKQFDKINKICSKAEIYNENIPKRLREGLQKERELGNAIEQEMHKRGLIQY